MDMPVEFKNALDDLARVMAADILETLSLEDIQQLIAEMEAEQRKLN
jgi:hypothetical protein